MKEKLSFCCRDGFELTSPGYIILVRCVGSNIGIETAIGWFESVEGNNQFIFHS